MTKIFKSAMGSTTFNTQKASGLAATSKVIEAMRDYGHALLSAKEIGKAAVCSAQTLLDSDGAEVEASLKAYYSLSFPLFARPCPTVPRHGFVDSREVVDMPDLRTMAQAAVDADPEAEIIIMRKLKGEASAIITKDAIAIGPGNDGATSGRSVTLYGPVMSQALGYAELVKKAKIADGDVPYVEAVSQSNKSWSLVQVRGGPPVPVCEDYVPSPMVVKRVLVATHDYDLLQWEKDVAAGAKEKGFVVDASSMSLTSHFAVHAVVNKVAVVTTKSPAIGDHLAPAGVDWKGEDYRRLAREIDQVDYVLSNPSTACVASDLALSQLAVGGLHLAGLPVPASAAQLRLTALGVVSAVKLMSMACIGEARHIRSNAKGVKSERAGRGRVEYVRVDTSRAEVAMSLMKQMAVQVKSSGRDVYYDVARSVPLAALSGILYPVGIIFRDVHWDSAYGGDAWSGIVAGCRSMVRALQQFSRRPSAATWAKVVELWNEAIHREHNGGAPALSKFGANKHDMDTLAKAPLVCVTALNLKDAWSLFGDPFTEFVAGIPEGTIRPIYQDVEIPDHIRLPGDRAPAPAAVITRHDLKGHLRQYPGRAEVLFLAAHHTTSGGLPSDCFNFTLEYCLAPGTHKRALELMREYKARLPVVLRFTRVEEAGSLKIGRRFGKHIKLMMLYANITTLEAPATVTTHLNMIQFKVGLGTGIKSTVVSASMKKWTSQTVTDGPCYGSDDDDGDDECCPRRDW